MVSKKLLKMIWKIALGVFIWWFITFLIVKPYFRLRSLRKKGGITYYFPLIGGLKLVTKGEKETRDSWGAVKQMMRNNSGTRFFASNLGPGIMIAFIEPNLIKLMNQNNDKYAMSPNTKILKILMPNSLLTIEGTRWKDRRKLISEAFHYDFLQQMIPHVRDTTLEFIEQWKKTQVEVDMLKEYQRLTGEIVGRIFFGNNFNGQQVEGKTASEFLIELLIDIMALFYTPFFHFFGWKAITWGLFSSHRNIIRRVRLIREFSAKIIRKRKEDSSTKAKDLLQILLDYQKQGESLSEEEIIDEFLTFFTAGMDTTAHLLTAATYYLEKNPKFRSALLDDIKNHIPNPNSATLEQLNSLELVQAFLRETLRLLPPVSIASNKIATSDHYLDDIFVPKGTMVSALLVANNYNPVIYKDLEEFNPYRWVKGHPDANHQGNTEPFSFIPFSAGQRNCIGQHLAMNESKLILSLMILNFNLSIREDYKLNMKLRILYEAEEPIPVKLIPINN